MIQDPAFLQGNRAFTQLTFPGVVGFLMLNGHLSLNDKTATACAFYPANEAIKKVRGSARLNLHLLFRFALNFASLKPPFSHTPFHHQFFG